MTMIGARLKTARLAAGYSLRSLADEVGVSAMALSKYERNDMMPGSRVLVALSNVLGRRLEYFLRPADVTVSAPVYRRRASMTRKEEAAVRAQVEDWVDRYLTLEDLVGQAAEFAVEGVGQSIATVEDAERVADEVRAAWQLGSDPIEDLVDVLEWRGIRIGTIMGSAKFDALMFWVNGSVPIVALKRGVPGDRARFNLAHELGHLVLRPTPDVNEDAAANRFAGAFLAPASAVYDELGRQRQSLSRWELSELKCRWGLSMKAWVHRAADLRIISQSATKSLYVWLAPFKAEEPGPQVSFEQPRRMLNLAMRARTERIVSPERAEELYGAPLPDSDAMSVPAAGACC